MTDWAKLTQEMERLLRLRTYPVAYKRLEKREELEKIPKVRKLEGEMQFCKLPTMVRRGGWTVGVVRENVVFRCGRINGLAPTTEKDIADNAARAGKTWFATVEDARKQIESLSLVPPGEAVLLAPLAAGKFEPDVILIYGSPAQLVLLMNGLQFRDYQRLQFSFVGEGACADGIAQCYNSGQPSLAIPCFGERRLGGVEEDELVIALPPAMMAKAVEGIQRLWERGFRYPISSPVQPEIPPPFLTEN